MTERVIVALISCAAMVAAAGHVVHVPAGDALPLAPDAWQHATEHAPRLDRYGNEIEDALGEYRLDIRGSLYERRSPETALTPLPAPSL